MPTSPGIYFDPAGSLKLINDYIHIVIPMDISFVKPHIENIKSVFGTVRYLCQQNQDINNLDCYI